MKKSLKSYLYLTVILSLLLGTSLAAFAASPTDDFDLQPHRGGRDVRPENTLYSFAYAMELGATTLEMDMQLTKDGEVVISHNSKLPAFLTKDENGNYVKAGQEPDIRDLTLAELRKYSVGEIDPSSDYYNIHGKTQIAVKDAKVPTLAEVFELINAYGNKTIKFNIETKIDPTDPKSPEPDLFVRKVMEVVHKYGMEKRIMLQTFDWRSLVACKRMYPGIATVALTCDQPSWGDSEYRRYLIGGRSAWMAGLDIKDFPKDNYVKAAQLFGADVISPYYEEISKPLVDEAHKYGMKVVVWTVNKAEDMNKMIDMGVDGIISDRPDILREVLIKRGIKVPAPTPAPSNMKYSTGTAINQAAPVANVPKGADASH